MFLKHIPRQELSMNFGTHYDIFLSHITETWKLCIAQYMYNSCKTIHSQNNSSHPFYTLYRPARSQKTTHDLIFFNHQHPILRNLEINKHEWIHSIYSKQTLLLPTISEEKNASQANCTFYPNTWNSISVSQDVSPTSSLKPSRTSFTRLLRMSKSLCR